MNSTDKISELVIATHNPAKLIYYKEALTGMVPVILGLRDIGITDKPHERGETAEENAEIKAWYYSAKTGKCVLSEDEALYADFLDADKQPATHVRRINGIEEADDDELLAHWETILSSVPLAERTGKWHVAFCLIIPETGEYMFSHDRPIRFFLPASRLRTPGWPLSSIEGWTEFNKPHSEWNDAERLQAQKETKENFIRMFAKLLEKIP